MDATQSPLAGKSAIVTGSTSGIGAAIARSLAMAGADLTLNGFGDAGEIEAMRSAIAEEAGVRCRHHGADMTQPEQIEDLIASTVSEHGSVDILVNNAGVQFTAPIEDFPKERWDWIVAINLSAVFHATKAALPHMRAKNWGRLINVASVHGQVASPKKSAYVAAKHGVIGLTKVTALETARSGITANAICPGWVRTPLVEKQIEDRAKETGASIDEAVEALLGEKQPSLDFATPDQLGALAVFLASPAADQIRGQSIAVDGGWLAQ